MGSGQPLWRALIIILSIIILLSVSHFNDSVSTICVGFCMITTLEHYVICCSSANQWRLDIKPSSWYQYSVNKCCYKTEALMTLGGNLSNLSGLMISVGHPPQVVARSAHAPWVSRQCPLTLQFITNPRSRPRLHFPPQPRQEIWLTWLPRYPRPLHYPPNFILIFYTTWPHPTGNNCP